MTYCTYQASKLTPETGKRLFDALSEATSVIGGCLTNMNLAGTDAGYVSRADAERAYGEATEALCALLPPYDGSKSV